MESYLFWTIWRHGEVCEVYKSSCCIFFSIAWFHCVWQRNELKLWGSAWTGTSFFSSSCLNKVSSSSSCIFQRLLYLIPFINWLVFTPVYGRFSHRSGWCSHQFACHQRLARGVWECLLFCTHTLTHTHTGLSDHQEYWLFSAHPGLSDQRTWWKTKEPFGMKVVFRTRLFWSFFILIFQVLWSFWPGTPVSTPHMPVFSGLSDHTLSMPWS